MDATHLEPGCPERLFCAGSWKSLGDCGSHVYPQEPEDLGPEAGLRLVLWSESPTVPALLVLCHLLCP